uniref:Uncharacterized protein n=1 Tax=Spongospora subterranea TaxID=70186 RepID=A0A0H5QX55_9EUKA|eukprot:CRZ06530.1 hypothetical protein [Spongospora subterranea]
MIEMEGQPSFTCDIDVFGSVGSIGADGVGEIGLAELVNRLRSDGIQSTAVKKVVSGYCNVGLLMDDSRSSIHFLHLEPKFGFLAESLKAARLVDLKFHRKHLLGLTTDGRVVGGGSNQFGQLGIGTIPGPSMNNLAIVPKLVNVICIATGESHSAACTADGNIYTWGSSFYGQCSGSRAIHLTPSSVHGIPPMCSVVCGAYFTLAVSATGGDVYGWGDNTSSQLGLGQFATCIRRPCRIPLPHSVVKLSCGYGHAAALGSDGMLVVWGLNSSGQIGIQGTSCGKTPSVLDVDPDLINKNHVVDVLCGPNFTALLDTSGRVFTFGSDTPKGRLGRPKGGGRLEPGRIQRIDEKKVHRITECSSALLCQTATTISRVDISTVCASGGTLITIYGYAIANIKGFAWIKFCYKPYVRCCLLFL